MKLPPTHPEREGETGGKVYEGERVTERKRRGRTRGSEERDQRRKIERGLGVER